MIRKSYLLILGIFIVFNMREDLLSQGLTRNKKIRTNVEKFSLIPFAEPVHADSIKIVTFLEIPFYSLQFIKQDGSWVEHQEYIKEKNN